MNIQLSPLLSDGMVLQRDARVRLWGTADGPVSIRFLGQEVCAEPDGQGRWEAFFEGLAPGGPHEMHIDDLCLRDVYVGDVWVCAGQSNMQLPMRRVHHMYPEEMAASTPYIRQFGVPERFDFSGPQADLAGGAWRQASPETIGDFSAVGYFFAKRLYARYGVPIGLIATAIGGTPVHSWMSRDALAAFPALHEQALVTTNETVDALRAADAENAARYYAAIDESDPGLAEGWQNPAYDDSGWAVRPLLSPWEGTGSMWLRKTVDLPPALWGKPAMLFLGSVKDWDVAYVDGQQVGTTGYRYPPREYEIPALPSGRCTIALRVISHHGGAFTEGKQYLLATGAGSINLGGDWKWREGGKAEPQPPESYAFKRPSGLYNGMIAPLHPYAVRGVIWYQGETDGGNPVGYADKFEAMVRDWRAKWGQALPFLSVELAHWAEAPFWSALRAQQWEALRIPQTALAAADDLGEYNDLHPQGKQAVGDRLARCAMRVAYGETLPPSPFEIVGL